MEPKIVDDQSVKQSLSYVSKVKASGKRVCTAEEERTAIREFDGGHSREDAERISGWKPEYIEIKQALRDELEQLRMFSSFAACLVSLTRPSILVDWHIGTGPNGNTIFWHQDVKGKFRNGKLIRFTSDGFHRDKNYDPRFLYVAKQGFKHCIFGEYQLRLKRSLCGRAAYSSWTPVVLVESEKSAIIASHHWPRFIWLATGGADGLSRDRARVLTGRRVLILFDCDEGGLHGRSRVYEILKSVGAKPEIIDQFKFFPEKPQGFDIADLIYAEQEDCLS